MPKDIKLPIEVNLRRTNNSISKSSDGVIYEEHTLYTLQGAFIHLVSFIFITSILCFSLLLSDLNNQLILGAIILLPIAYFNFTRAYNRLIEKHTEKTIEIKFNKNQEVIKTTIITREAPRDKVYTINSTIKINFNINQIAYKHTKEKDADNDIIEKNEIILLSTRGDEFSLLKMENNTNIEGLLSIFSELYDVSVHSEIIINRT